MNKYQELYNAVLQKGQIATPRGKQVLEIGPVLYVNGTAELIDTTTVRNISLSYIAREFLWFCHGDHRDLRIAKYAPLWNKCIDEYGTVNSNYGLYLFGEDKVFFTALDLMIADIHTRRCWIPIFQSYHQTFPNINDYPCTTGLGFQLFSDYRLDMTVHMRSQDAWHGMGNDIPVCALLHQLARAYLRSKFLLTDTGPMTHFINNLHLYERHWTKAIAACADTSVNQAAVQFNDLIGTGFNSFDVQVLMKRVRYNSLHASDLLNELMQLAGDDYGYGDPIWGHIDPKYS